MYLVSVSTEKDFHIWCRELHKKPGVDACFVPHQPLTHRAQALEGKTVPSAELLVGQFTQEERDQLIVEPPVTFAPDSKKKAKDGDK